MDTQTNTPPAARRLTLERVREIKALAVQTHGPDGWGRSRNDPTPTIRIASNVVQIVPPGRDKWRLGTFPKHKADVAEVKAVIRARGFRFVPETRERLGKLWRVGELCLRFEERGHGGIQLTFWPNYGGDNPNGPEYGSDAVERMRRPELARFRHTLLRLRWHFLALGYLDVSDPAFRFAREEIEFRLRTSGHFLEFPDENTDLPDPRPNASAYGNNRAKDGTPLANGQIRCLYDHRGRLRRGRVYYSLNNMWLVEVSPLEYVNAASFDLFTYRGPAEHPARRPTLAHLRNLIARAVAAEKYELAIHLRRERERLYPGAGQGKGRT